MDHTGVLTNSVFNVCEKIAVVIFSLCQVNGSLILASCVESHSTSCYSPFILFCASLVYLLPLRYRESLPTLYMTIELWNKLYVNNLYPECKRIVVVRTISKRLIAFKRLPGEPLTSITRLLTRKSDLLYRNTWYANYNLVCRKFRWR